MEEWIEKEKAAREKKKLRGKSRSRRRMHDKTVNDAEQVCTDLKFDTLPISSSGWMGRRYDDHGNSVMKRRWSDRTIESDMVMFKRVCFNTEYVALIYRPLIIRLRRPEIVPTTSDRHQRPRRASDMQEVDVSRLHVSVAAPVGQ